LSATGGVDCFSGFARAAMPVRVGHVRRDLTIVALVICSMFAWRAGSYRIELSVGDVVAGLVAGASGSCSCCTARCLYDSAEVYGCFEDRLISC
jgi:hypothetical protein